MPPLISTLASGAEAVDMPEDSGDSGGGPPTPVGGVAKGCGMAVLIGLAVVGAIAIFFFVVCLVAVNNINR